MMLAVSRLALWHQVVVIEVLRHLPYNEPLDDLRHEGEIRDGVDSSLGHLGRRRASSGLV